MPLLEAAFPAFVVNLCYTQGITGAITTLNKMGDTPAAQNLYDGYAAQLVQWGQTVPSAPSTVALTPLVGMAETTQGLAPLNLSAAGVATG